MEVRKMKKPIKEKLEIIGYMVSTIIVPIISSIAALIVAIKS